MTYERSAFTSYKSTPTATVNIGPDSRANIVCEGDDIVLRIIVRGKSVKFTIRNVNHVPTLRYQLLSVLTMGILRVLTSFDDNGAVLRNKTTNQALALGSVVNNLYASNVDRSHTRPEKALVVNLSLWLQRLAHINATDIKKMADNNVVKGAVLKSKQNEINCEGFILGKCYRFSE